MVRQHEDKSQAEVLLSLRYAIDTAIAHTSLQNAEVAIAIARGYPQALRSTRVSRGLGATRWEWLNAHGVYAQEIGTIEPEIET